MDWIQLSLQIERNQADLVSEVLMGLGSISITFSDTFDNAIYEPPVGQTPLWKNVTINALFHSDVNQKYIKSSVIELCGVELLTFNVLKDRAWKDEFKKDFHAMQFGKNLWICPSWEEQAQLPSDAIVINMNPGLAFGTGNHQTTDLCLQYLDANPPKNLNVIDFGCGAGVLAIAAAKLGAKSVLAIDNDPQAVHATRENVIHNQCENIITTMHSEEESDFGKCDVLVANILTNPLIELVSLFAKLVRPNGSLVLSGILKEQSDMIVSCYAQYFSNLEISNKDEWCRVCGTRQY